MKAQMEILGLAFLFVLIIFGFLFYLNINTDTFNKNTKDDYLQPKRASAFGDMILHTTVHCKEGDRSLRDLFIDCMSKESGFRQLCTIDRNLEYFPYTGSYNPLDWADETLDTPFTYDSCQTFKLFADIAGNVTLQKWAEAYYVEAYVDADITEDPEDDLPSKIGDSIQHAEPMKDIDRCYSGDAIRSRRSRNQPLPLLDGRFVTMRVGICY